MSIQGFTLLIDGKDIKMFGMSLVSYEIQSYVKRKTTGVDIPGAHGTQSVPSALSSSGFTAKVICTGKDADDVHTRVRQFFSYMFSKQDSHETIFTDDINAVRYAILDSPDKYKVIKGIDGAFTEMTLTFLMLDPFTYRNESDKLAQVAESGIGIIFENEAYECPALFTLENTGSSPVTGISLIVNGELVTYSCTLNQGDKIVLDTNEYEVRLNGEVRLDYWEGEMPMLKNGDNVIIQQNSRQAPLLLTVEFTKQWV